MKSFKTKRFASLTRQGRFQFLTVIVILGAGVLLSMLFGLRGKSPDDIEDLHQQMQADWLFEKNDIQSRADCVRLLREARQLRANYGGSVLEEDPGEWISVAYDETRLAGVIRPMELRALKTYLRVIRPGSSPRESSLATMAACTEGDPASGLIASMEGDLLALMEKPDEAVAAYQRGATDAETGHDSKIRLMLLCVRRHWHERLGEFYQQAGWREIVRNSSLMEWDDSHAIMVAAKDWAGLLWHTTSSLSHSLKSPAWLAVALGCGIVWFLLLHIAAGIKLQRWWVGGAAFLLGVASIPLTLFFITLQHHYFDIERAGGDHRSIFYCISGIGFREEIAKLICFVPLLPFLRGQTTPVHALVAASCVGLGFAIEENISYFASTSGTSVFGRFVTANFIHISLTGLSGLALWLAIKSPAKWLQHFVVVFVGAVLFHGLWDWSPGDARISGDYAWLLYAGFIGLAYYYFGELRRFRGIVPSVLSPAWIFLCGISLIMVLVMCLTSYAVGFRYGFVLSMQGALGLFVIGAAMYYQLRRD